MSIYLFQIVNGIGLGMIYFLIAVGLSITLGLLGFVNFAHGIFYLLGAYMTFQLVDWTGSFWMAALLAPPIVALFAFLLERTILKHTYNLAHKYQIIVTLGIVLIVQEVVVMMWGALGHSVSMPEALSGVISIGDFPYPIYRIFVVAVAAAIGLGLWLLLEKTKFGALIRAGSESSEVVSLLGVDIRWVMSGTLVLGAFIAAIAGVLIAPIRGAEPHMNVEALGVAFVVVIIGGMGSFTGSILAGILIGVVQSLMSTIWAEGSQLMVYVAMTVVLIAAPRGLLGRA
jgi:branched-chain amino acid transport system permease protein